MSQKQELLLQESRGLKANKPAKNLDATAEGASLLLEEEFVMHIFASLYDELLPFKEYLDYHFEEKEGNVIGSRKEEACVLAIDKAMAELLWPQHIESCQTTGFCWELLVGVATTLLTELTDPKKINSKLHQ